MYKCEKKKILNFKQYMNKQHDIKKFKIQPYSKMRPTSLSVLLLNKSIVMEEERTLRLTFEIF